MAFLLAGNGVEHPGGGGGQQRPPFFRDAYVEIVFSETLHMLRSGIRWGRVFTAYCLYLGGGGG